MASSDTPVTKEDLLAAFVEFEARMDKKFENVETSLLTAFHRYAERVDLRLRNVETFATTSLDRLTKLEAGPQMIEFEMRLREIERRLHIPRPDQP